MSAELLDPLLPWVEILGQALLHFLWQGIAIALCYRAARVAMSSAGTAAQAACGQAAFGLFATAPFLTIWLLARGEEGSAASSLARQWFEPTFGAPHSGSWADAPSSPALLGLVVALWLSGVVTLSLRNFRAWQRDSRLVEAASSGMPLLQRQCARLAARLELRVVPEVRELAGLSTPCLIGWLRPVVLLPLGLALRLPPAQLEALLLHELAHLRRADYLANLLQTTVETLLFYHPAVHWVGRQLRADRESACDDVVLTAEVDRVAYARALASLELARQGMPALAQAAAGGQLLGRIERILGAPAVRSHARPGKPADRRVPALLALGCGGLLGLAALLEIDADFFAVDLSLLDLQLPPAPITLPSPALRIELPNSRSPRYSLPLPPAAPAENPVAAFGESSPGVDLGRELTPPRAGAEARLKESAPTLSVQIPASQQDTAPPDQARSGSAAHATANVLEPRLLHGAQPAYPRRAHRNGLEGYVVLSFVLDENGRARDIQVESASPYGVFDAAARSALRNAQFEYRPNFAGRLFQRRFDFSLADPADVTASAPLFGKCVPPVGTRICRDR